MQNTTKRSFKAGTFARASVNVLGIVDSSLNFAALKENEKLSILRIFFKSFHGLRVGAAV